jgi:pyruvate/2-oxoglutarate dehydrogenase complex dihydrolipoamide dehydrogenase (E3) component/uncharacterized membrane protein YdjX (TVP38/TMEM64 family)
MRKSIILLLLISLILIYFALDLDSYLSFQNLKSGLGQFEMWRIDSPVLTGIIFFSFYVAVAALSLPGAVVMTLAAGALFGLFWGTIIVSFASSIGATFAFLVSRYLFRDAIQKRFGDRLRTINNGIAKDGKFYLFTLRLVPLFPFFIVNLLMGLTPIRTVSYYWVSQVGMFSGTLVYVNAGTHLAKISGFDNIISPGLLVSFTLLGVFPLLAKWLLHYLQRRRVYAKWKRPENFDRNLIVIGAGAAGLVTAYIGAAVKAKVTLIEAQKMGGDCLNYGCVPSKTLIKSARIRHQLSHGDNYGLKAKVPEFNFKEVMARVHEVIRTIAPHDSAERYTELGVEVLKGYAYIKDPWTVEIKLHSGEIQSLTTRNIVIATGAKPVVPDLPGLDKVDYVTSDTLWDKFAKKDSLPSRLIVLGGGPIGCELAQSFARLGSTVTQIEMASRIMVREDEEVSEIVQSSLERDGVHILTDHRALSCERDGDHKFITVAHDGTEQRIEFDELLCAVGRKARLTGYGLEELGIETQNTIVTNEYLETLYPNIFAAGDVAGPFQFTHTASHQAWYAAVNALFGDFKKFKVDYSIIPRATFVDPEVARVGLNEQEAKKQDVPYETTRYKFDELDRAITDSSTHGFVKVLTTPGKDHILGATIVGEHAGDLLAEFVLAMKYRLGLSKILGTIHTYPTFSEANKNVAGIWKIKHAPQRLLMWLFRYHTWKR